MRALLLMVSIFFLAASPVLAQDRAAQLDCGQEELIPLGKHDSGMNIWRDPRTGDVLIQGNMPGKEPGEQSEFAISRPVADRTNDSSD